MAEDYAIVAHDALRGVQVKATDHSVTVNSDDIIESIDSFVNLRKKNPQLKIELRHLTTSKIGKEKSATDRIGDSPTLETWRKLAKAGDVEPLRKILDASKISKQTKTYIRTLDDKGFREEFLKRIHFDCGAPDSKFLVRLLRAKLLRLVIERGGVNSQVDGCLNSILIALLQTATQKDERFVDRNALEALLEKATQITINRAQFETQNQLINKMVGSIASQTTSIIDTRLAEPKPLHEVPFPVAIANRTVHIDNIVSSLSQCGVSWIFGAAGVGKTLGAKIAARRLEGNWAGINLRGLNCEQVDAVLSSAINGLTGEGVDGFLVDDLECPFEPRIVDVLLYLRAICDQGDILLLFTSPRQPDSDFLFSANLTESIMQKLEEFSEYDISEILTGLGIPNVKNWAKYIHIVSGGGHPQLAVAAIQSMQNSGWDTNEFKTWDSLLVSNPAIEQVRTRTRERLLNELPEGGRRLLERLSLKIGGFRRSFVLDMAQIAPTVPDGGIVFDKLIGSWVDQQESDRFALSPLLSNLAVKTLTDEQKREINFKIANSLIKSHSIDLFDANSALIAALAGKNTKIIIKLCLAVLGAELKDIDKIAPHLLIFTIMRTDTFAYEDNPTINQMFRGAQLLLLTQEVGEGKPFQEVVDCFETESSHVKDKVARNLMSILVYSKLLLSKPKFGALPNFWDLVRKLDGLLEKRDNDLPPELLSKFALRQMDGTPIASFMFVTQAMQINLIKGLLPVFEFLNSCGQEFRQKLLKPYDNPGYNIDMLVVNPWLKEHEANTIDPPSHSKVFARLEDFAKSWGHTDLAVCCRKYRAVIIDEYGTEKDQALAVLNEGLEDYGETNSVLVRAKAKVLYRAEDHQGSLELSKALIERNAPLTETEKAFLGREAAISAEKQGDYETARRYYLYGSDAAKNCVAPNMAPMRVGLMADAAMASWHAGDRATCLCDLVTVLVELKDIDPQSSLRAAHCHAICRHVLLWLDQAATGEKQLLSSGEETKIYPGVVSNPEPHPEIGKQFLVPIEMAWYMLAAVENDSCLEVGITKNLSSYLLNGPVFEGQFQLTRAKMRKAFMLSDIFLFVESLRETIAEFAYVKEKGDYKNSFNIEKVKYGSFPVPTLEQRASNTNLAEMFVLSFVANWVFAECSAELNPLFDALERERGFNIRKDLLDCLRGRGFAVDYNTSSAELLAIHIHAIEKKDILSPAKVFELAFKALQISIPTDIARVVAKFALGWLNRKWIFICEHQRFLLKCPTFYDNLVTQVAIAKTGSWVEDLIAMLQAILPTLGISNESQLNHILNDIKREKRWPTLVNPEA